MRKHFLLAAVLLGTLPFGSIPGRGSIRGREGHPSHADGKPNLQGVWQHPYVPDEQTATRPEGRGGPSVHGFGGRTTKSYDVSKFDYTGHCLPFGLMRSMNVVAIPSNSMQMRLTWHCCLSRIRGFMSSTSMGASTPKDLDPTWFGHSIGKWAGDTLVVDTIGFNGKTRLDTAGHPHTDALHVIERFQLTDRSIWRTKSRLTIPRPTRDRSRTTGFSLA